jgi:hypothetical protein
MGWNITGILFECPIPDRIFFGSLSVEY